ncbi:hypothetical protein MAR_014028 [Mya arenaria]|uniref:Gfo/Idh/MocA-like oxidoreductase C-terminal domain-containing protein n=1 Tax=Mya arenaria TaxID=6604 RepID=A0ABY7G4T4_MYAAR|nr:hypothetical protein MAR_014028 [Mya arenaria]
MAPVVHKHLAVRQRLGMMNASIDRLKLPITDTIRQQVIKTTTRPSYEFLKSADSTGCNILADLGVHDIDMVVWLTRAQRPESIYITCNVHDEQLQAHCPHFQNGESQSMFRMEHHRKDPGICSQRQGALSHPRRHPNLEMSALTVSRFIIHCSINLIHLVNTIQTYQIQTQLKQIWVQVMTLLQMSEIHDECCLKKNEQNHILI